MDFRAHDGALVEAFRALRVRQGAHEQLGHRHHRDLQSPCVLAMMAAFALARMKMRARTRTSLVILSLRFMPAVVIAMPST